MLRLNLKEIYLQRVAMELENPSGNEYFRFETELCIASEEAVPQSQQWLVCRRLYKPRQHRLNTLLVDEATFASPWPSRWSAEPAKAAGLSEGSGNRVRKRNETKQKAADSLL